MRPRTITALVVASCLWSVPCVTIAVRAARGSPSVRVRTHDARRDSDRQRHRREYDRSRDPVTMREGEPLSLPLVSPPVAFDAAPPARPSDRPYDTVVIVSLDGLRPDAIDLTDAPNLRRLRALGADAREARTISHSYTLPSHAAMLTGVDTDAHGLVHNNFVPARGFVRVPTIFYAAHDAGFATAMFVSKPKFRHLAIPGSVDLYTRPDYVCRPVVRAATQYLAHAPPGIAFVHLSEPDEAGHDRGWMTRAYLESVARVDRCVGTLLEAIAQRTDRDRVLLLVTADHGGHGRTHGSTRDEDLRIPWIAWGSRVRTGAFDEPVSTMDTAATALAALGVAVDPRAPMAGHVVSRVLDGAVTAPAALAVPDRGTAASPPRPDRD